MSKKSRRARAKNRPAPILSKPAPIQQNQPVRASNEPPRTAAVARSAGTMAAKPINYDYVLSDLKKIGIISAILIIILVVLTFVLR